MSTGAVVGSVQPLPRHSDEFSRLEHLLEVSSRSTAVKDVAAWSIANPHLTVMYERRATGMLSVDCWVDIASLDARNPVQEVCKRGFYMPESGEGLPFTTGNIRFDMDGPDTHQYLLCTVAVGRSYVQDDPAAPRSLPASYDSLYLHIPEAGTGDAAEGGGDLTSGDAYRHTYVVFDAAQVIPRYVVHFAYHPRERLLRQPVKPINLAEIKARVADALSLLGPAAPAATEKMLSDIGDAYEAAINSSQSGDPLLEERKKGIRGMLAHIDGKLQAVQANSAAVEEALYARLQDALFQLQEETQRKMNLLLSEELELRRQLQQIEWTEGFVHTMQETLPPMSFVSAWERHAALRSQLYSQLSGGLSARVLEEVQPDMKLVGSIEVTTERAAAAAAFSAAAAATSGKGVGSAASMLLGAGPAGGAGGGGLGSTFDASGSLGALPSAAQLGASLAAGGADPSTINNLLTSLLRESMGIRASAPEPAPAAAAAPSSPPSAAGAARYGGGSLNGGHSGHESPLAGHAYAHHGAAASDRPMAVHPRGAGAAPAPHYHPAAADSAHLSVSHLQPHSLASASGTAVLGRDGATTARTLPHHLQQHHAGSGAEHGYGAASHALVQAPAPHAPAAALLTAEQAQLALSTAKGQLAAVERGVEALPPGMRAQGEGARAQAQQRVAEAEAAYASKVREEANAILSAAHTGAAAAPSAAGTLTAGAGAGAAAAPLVPRPPSSPAGAGAAPGSPSKAGDAEARRARHSIRAEAERKRRVYGLDNPDPALAFPSSRILTPADAAALYLCLPFGVADDGTGMPGALPPIAKLIWATYDGSHTVQSFINAYAQLGNGEPTVLLVKSKEGQVFGGYAADAWAFDDLFGGTPRSFLFSLSRDVKLPYTGRQRGPKQITDDLLRQEQEALHEQELAGFSALEREMAAANGGVAPYDEQGRLLVYEEDEAGNAFERAVARPKPRPFVRCDALKSTARSLQFGVRDLVLAEDFTRCSSEVEASYGIGLKPGSAEARSLLAGAHEFVPETIEIWTVSGDVAGSSVAGGESAGYGGGYGGSARGFDGEGSYVDEYVEEE